MDRPLIREENKALRRRAVQLLRAGYSVKREGNIVFVCGGNNPFHMRQQFKDYCRSNHPEFEIFFPEYAMKEYFSGSFIEQLDIADFEEMIGDLSHAIVLFPEAPGSYAEAGYFSAKTALAEKTILALDVKWQGFDSFISMGPARKINNISKFYGVIQTEYSNPKFNDIVKRIERISLSKNRKSLNIEKFSDLSNYEVFCVVYKIFDILTIATIEDIDFMMNSIFEAHFSRPKMKQIASILVGSNYITPIGEYGHYFANPAKRDILRVLNGKAHEESSINLELGGLYVTSDTEFLSIIEDAQNAA